MQNNEKYQIYKNNYQDSNYPTYENIMKQNQNIFALINEHKSKLNQIRNMENISDNEKFSINEKYSINKKLNDDNKEDICNTIKIAKEFLNYNKSRTSQIYSNIDNAINTTKSNNSFHSNYLNYDIGNDFQNSNNKTYINSRTQYNYRPSNNYYSSNTLIDHHNKGFYYTPKSQIIFKSESSSKLDNLNNINEINNNLNRIKNSFNNTNYNNEINEKYNEDNNNKLISSNIKLLEHKLENKENQIKSLESNITFLNNENQNLKQYINKLETSLQSIENQNYTKNNNNNNNNDIFSENSQNILINENDSDNNNNVNNNNNNLLKEDNIKNNLIQTLINKENISTINDSNNINNIEKIMNTINYFIRKMYILFNNIIEQKENFNDLNCNQHYELQKHLIKIENIINNLFIQNINMNKDKYYLDNKNTINIDKKNDYEYEESLSGINSVIGRTNNGNDKIKSNIIKKSENKNKNVKKSKKTNINQNKNIKRSKSHNRITIFPKKNSFKSKTKKKYN